jgi:hypothetical protein
MRKNSQQKFENLSDNNGIGRVKTSANFESANRKINENPRCFLLPELSYSRQQLLRFAHPQRAESDHWITNGHVLGHAILLHLYGNGV